MNGGNAEADKGGNAEADKGGNMEANRGGNKPVASTPLSAGDIYPSLADVELSALSKKQLVRVMRGYFKAHYSESHQNIKFTRTYAS